MIATVGDVADEFGVLCGWRADRVAAGTLAARA
jgi:hypothetical protein